MTHDHDPPEPPDSDDHLPIPGEEHAEGEDHGPEDEPMETVEGSIDTAGKIIGAINKGVEGEGLGAAAGGIGAATGLVETIAGAVDDEEARRVLEGVGTVLEVAEKATEVAEKLSELAGHGGHGAGGHGAGGHGAPGGHGAAGRHGAGRHGADRFTSEEVFGRSDDRFSAEDVFGSGTTANVEYHLEVEGSDVTFHVRSVAFQDGVTGLPTCLVSATCAAHALAGEPDVFDKEVTVRIERGDDIRQFKGLVRRGNVTDGTEHQTVDLDVVPGVWLLSQTQDSRVFQDVSVPDLVDQIVREYLPRRHRTVRSELTQTYLPHEYLVQYRESVYEFLRRLCDEEGIWFYFDHSEDEGREVLVLCDSNENRPRITGGNNGRIQYSEHRTAREMEECAYDFERARWIGPTDAVHSGYDWTNPPLTVRHEETGHGETDGPALEIHEHRSATRPHRYDGTQYGEHTTRRYTTQAVERLRLARRFWTCSTSVVGVEPGHVMELEGANEHDGRYLVISVSVTGQTGQAAGGFNAALELVPIDFPYRPPAPTRPVAQGPETATVTGPAGEEIHCDKHGRVKVQFHWDRLGKNDDQSSVWIRVAQFWAGQGWGSMFIPRIGTEVIVSFLGGDPDRPVITGRLFNGNHPVPYPLPEHKTRSTIMTNSSPGKNGFNELRFEDKAGDEEVYIHAEKDFNEEVKNCHSTHVGRDQSNTVDRNQTETVKQDQKLTVERDRVKTVVRDEEITVKGNRKTQVGPDGGDDLLYVTNDRSEIVDGFDRLHVSKGDKLTDVIQGKWDITTKGEFKVLQNGATELTLHEYAYLDTKGRVQLKSGHGEVHYDASAGGELEIKSSGTMMLKTQSDQKLSASGSSGIYAGDKIMIEAESEITLKCGSSTIKLTPSGIEIGGGQIKIAATSGNVEVDAAGLVKLKG